MLEMVENLCLISIIHCTEIYLQSYCQRFKCDYLPACKVLCRFLFFPAVLLTDDIAEEEREITQSHCLQYLYPIDISIVGCGERCGDIFIMDQNKLCNVSRLILIIIYLNYSLFIFFCVV